MTAKELKRLSRNDLLEMMLELSKENQQLREQLEKLQEQQNNRRITIENAGSLAEAALKLQGVFQTAQAACDQYCEDVQARYEIQTQACTQMEQETRMKCEKMLENAKKEADDYWEFVRKKVRNLYADTLYTQE